MQGEPVAEQVSMTLQQPGTRYEFSPGSCPWITGHWQWRSAQVPVVGEVWIVTCACTWDSLWLQQQC